VASISLGERALFQFVKRGKADEPTRVVAQQWLDDRSLQLFGGDTWKKRLLHRVLRVDRRGGTEFDVRVPSFSTRRVNLTFRYVPDERVPFAKFGSPVRRARVRPKPARFFAAASERDLGEANRLIGLVILAGSCPDQMGFEPANPRA
jgi:hypothetical protein